jgi:glycerate kinase
MQARKHDGERRGLRVLVAPDKFKGTLTAAQAADAIARGWERARPEDVLERFPISDGGDGFGELLGQRLRAQEREVDTVDAAQQPVRARWWWVSQPRLAVVESARVIGLAMLPQGRFHPRELDTFGLGALLAAVARRQPRTCLVGVGGSATNDGGFGLARALGWVFLDRAGGKIEIWTALHRLAQVKEPVRRLNLGRLVVAVDVGNPLLGVHGATRVYGPQKGIRPADAGPAERCLRRLARVIARQLPSCRRLAVEPGAGAAGGLGFGLAAFAGAVIKPGFALFARLTGFAARVGQADVVLTGEGAIDATSVLMGKGVGQVARLAGKLHRPCLGLAGTVNATEFRRHPFCRLHAIVPVLATSDAAKAQPAFWLTRLAQQAAEAWSRAPSPSASASASPSPSR